MRVPGHAQEGCWQRKVVQYIVAFFLFSPRMPPHQVPVQVGVSHLGT